MNIMSSQSRFNRHSVGAGKLIIALPTPLFHVIVDLLSIHAQGNNLVIISL